MNDKIPKPEDIGSSAQGPLAREAWHLFGIMSEFFEATERMNRIRPAVSLFGSARVPARATPTTCSRSESRACSRTPASPSSQAVVDAIFKHQEGRSFAPPPEERESLLNP